MNKKELILIILISLFTTCIFFYKTVLFHQIPFPGDLLVNQQPYKSESFLGYAPGGYPNMAQGIDVATQMYPWKYFTIQELKAERIPFWNPHNFSGNLHLQNYQTGVFYPLNVFFFIFPFSVAWTIFIMSQPFLAIIFMYLFLRNLSLGRITSITGAIAFGFSSYMTVWMEYGNIGSTLLWLPLILFAIKKFIEKQKAGDFLLTVAVLTISFLAGYIQGVFYIYILAIGYTLYLLLSHRRRFLMGVEMVLVFVFPVLFAAFQILPTYDLFTRSTRSPYSLVQIANLLQPLYYWVTIFVPDFFGNPAHRNYFLPITYIERVMYMGISLLLFVFVSIVKVKDKTMRFFLLMGIVFLILTTNFPLIKYFYLISIPMISTTVPTRALSIFLFCLIIVGCYGIEFWQKQKVKTRVPLVYLGMYGIICLSVFLFPKLIPEVVQHKSIVMHNLVIPVLIAVVTVSIWYLRELSITFSSVLLLIVLTGDLLFFFYKITPFAPQSLIYPKTPVISWLQTHGGINRFWGYGSAYIPSNFQTYDGTYSPEGNDPLHRKEYGLLLASSAEGKYPDVLPRPDANIAPGYGVGGMKNIYRQKVLNLLGVKYLLNQENTSQPRYDLFPDDMYKLIWQQKSWQIYENKQVLPRFFLGNRYIVAPTNQQALHAIYTQDIAKTIILNRNPKATIDAHSTGMVSLVHYDPDDPTFQTNATGNMILFLSDEYYYSWHAKVDGREVPVYKADLSFRAVIVPKGKHTVMYYYAPFYFPLGLKIAGGSLMICLVYLIYLMRKK